MTISLKSSVNLLLYKHIILVWFNLYCSCKKAKQRPVLVSYPTLTDNTLELRNIEQSYRMNN